MGSSVLVTGSSGTIGTAVLEFLVEDGYDARGLDIRNNGWSADLKKITTTLDLRSFEVDELVRFRDIDIILHSAANARVVQSVQNPSIARDNFKMTFNVLELARRFNIPNVIFLSSREVYDDSYPYVCTEEMANPRGCESPYAASKIGEEALVNSYSNCYDINHITLRLSNVYGRYDASDRVVPLFIVKALRNEDLTVYGANK